VRKHTCAPICIRFREFRRRGAVPVNLSRTFPRPYVLISRALYRISYDPLREKQIVITRCWLSRHNDDAVSSAPGQRSFTADDKASGACASRIQPFRETDRRRGVGFLRLRDARARGTFERSSVNVNRSHRTSGTTGGNEKYSTVHQVSVSLRLTRRPCKTHASFRNPDGRATR